ncbi:MAG: hypothetical protein BWY86_00950 [Candidatus Aminicenantes bacterium ADurb.Bin508]|nr:MAG: hypothetical protein BWY86_00950 [Candidatus Aminicenantes bacterium ADurb.Bin508]
MKRGTAVVSPEMTTDEPVETKVSSRALSVGRATSSAWKRLTRWIGFSTPKPKMTSKRNEVIVFRLPTRVGTRA